MSNVDLPIDGAALARRAFAAGLMPDPYSGVLRRTARELDLAAAALKERADRLRELADELARRRR